MFCLKIKPVKVKLERVPGNRFFFIETWIWNVELQMDVDLEQKLENWNTD